MTWLPVSVTVEPASEPITLDEAKAQLRVESDDDDAYIESLIAAARVHIEQMTGIKVLTQTVEFRASAFTDLAALPVAPVQSVTSVKYLDSTGAEQTLSTDVYETALTGLSPSIRPKYNQFWPSYRLAPDAIRVVAVVGYSEAPEPIKHAVNLIVSRWYDDRDTGAVPDGAMALLTNYRCFA